MYVIAGLGNPTSEYDGTRHNVGFMVIDALAKELGTSVTTKKMKGLLGQGFIGGEKVILVKPQTYMNLSGECLQQVLAFYKLPPEKLIVAVDDINLDTGRIRVRGKGSAGGHNGLKSIINLCGSQEFSRIRVGVGAKNPNQDLADYVLSHFGSEERKLMDETAKRAADAIGCLITEGLETAMNRYNRAD